MFDKEVWEGFEEKTQSGREPFLFESLLPLASGFATAKTVESAFYALRDRNLRETLDCRIRVYDGENRRDDLIEGAFSQDTLPDEALMGFMQRLTGKERFSLVVNNLEQASPKLAADFGQLIQSFFDYKGFPIGGVEQAAFCGNYSGTAFGIHEGFEHAFLCHLGPGVKDFYCWSRELYVEMVGHRAPTFADSEAYERLLETATLHVLKPGDVLYLPASVYHIGRQDQYSVSVALPFYTYPLKRFLSGKVIPALSDLTLPFDEEGMSALVPLKNDNPLLSPVTELLESTVRSWVDHELPHYLNYYWHRLRSNGGWELPRAVSENLLSDTRLSTPERVQRGSVVSLRQPFLASYEAGLDCGRDEFRVFIGARSIVLPDPHGHLVTLLERLNQRESVSVDSDELIDLLREMSRTGGIHCH